MDNLHNRKSTLEKQYFDIAHMTNSVKILGLLKDCQQVNKNLISESGSFDNVIDDMREIREEMNERKSVFEEYSNENYDSTIDDELLSLYNDCQKEKDKNDIKNESLFDMFPSVNKVNVSNNKSDDTKNTLITENNQIHSSKKLDEESLDELIKEFNK